MEVRTGLPAALLGLADGPVRAVGTQRVADAQLRVQRRAVGGAVVQTGLLVGGEAVAEAIDRISAQRRTSTLQLPFDGLLQLDSNKQDN